MDIKLYYQEAGSGMPLILLHGNGESGRYFVHQMDAFSSQYRVIALDTRGHGQSPRGKAPFTLWQFAEDLADFLEEQGIQRCHLLGFSDGGNIALLFALAHPDRVEKLILNGANLFPRGVKTSVQLPILVGYALTRAIAILSPSAGAKADLLGLMIGQPNLSPTDLARLPMPVLVLAGDHDMIRTAHSQLIAASIPNATLCLLPGDHFIAAKESAAFNRVVAAFLNDGSPHVCPPPEKN